MHTRGSFRAIDAVNYDIAVDIGFRNAYRVIPARKRDNKSETLSPQAVGPSHN